jgi:spermidine synthase/tetratricopeptide (TPR) repeat protein
MLVAFISGITVGSAIVARVISRSHRLVEWLAGTQAGIAGSMLLILPLYGLVPYVFWWTAHLLDRSDASYPFFLALQFAFGFILLVVPTVFMGMGLPVAARIASQRADRVGSSVGLVFSVNTIGTVLGTLAAGLVFFPAVGVQRTVEIAVVLNALAAGVVLGWGGGMAPRAGRLLAVAVVAVAAIGIYISPAWSQATALSGVFRYINKNVDPPSSYREFVQRFSPLAVPYYREGTTATVGVIETPANGGVQRVLIINGKPDASSVADLPTQVLLGQLPMFLHDDPKRALVIGLGSGVTAGSVLRHPIERVDGVEISPEVVEAAETFSETNGRPMDDPRFHLTVDDALTMLQLTDRRYDVIVSEPSNPWIAGIGSLYTSEFFALCRERLSDDGLMVQWFHLYEMDDEMFRLVLRTFQSAFPHVSIWSPLSTDVILIGSAREINPDEDRWQRLWGQPEVRSDLERIGIGRPSTLYTLQVMDGDNVRRYADEGPLNTEDLPRLEYGAPRAFFVNRGVKGLEPFDQRLHVGRQPLPLQRRWQNAPFSMDELSDAARWHENAVRGTPSLAYQFLAEMHRRDPRNVAVISRYADIAVRVGNIEEGLQLLRKRVELDPRDPEALEVLAWKLFDAGQRNATSFASASTDESERLLRRAVEIVKDTVDRYRVRLADIMYAEGRYRQAMDQYARAIQLRETHRPDPYIAQDQLFTRLAMCLYQVGDRSRAAGYALRATQLNPRNELARDLVFRLWTEGSVVSKSE